MTSFPLLAARNVHKSYRRHQHVVHVLQGVELAVYPGELRLYALRKEVRSLLAKLGAQADGETGWLGIASLEVLVSRLRSVSAMMEHGG